jgi:hypothetical protein
MESRIVSPFPLATGFVLAMLPRGKTFLSFEITRLVSILLTVGFEPVPVLPLA